MVFDIRSQSQASCCDYQRVTATRCHRSCQADDLEVGMTARDSWRRCQIRRMDRLLKLSRAIRWGMPPKEEVTRPQEEATACLLPGTLIAHMLLPSLRWLFSFPIPREIISTQTVLVSFLLHIHHTGPWRLPIMLSSITGFPTPSSLPLFISPTATTSPRGAGKLP